MAIYADITIDQGSDFASTVSIVDAEDSPINLTGYTFRGQIKKTYTSTTKVDFTITSNDPSTGNILLALTAATTDSMKSGRYLYDVEVISSGGIVTRVIEGQVYVNPSVTRD